MHVPMNELTSAAYYSNTFFYSSELSRVFVFLDLLPRIPISLSRWWLRIGRHTFAT